MPTYVYRCEKGHVTELVLGMADEHPADIRCTAEVCPTTLGCDCVDACEEACGQRARRVFTPLAAIHFHAGGFYETDYRKKYDYKRRPNAGDDLPLPAEAAITRAEGAEYDPPKHIPGGVIQRTPV